MFTFVSADRSNQIFENPWICKNIENVKSDKSSLWKINLNYSWFYFSHFKSYISNCQKLIDTKILINALKLSLLSFSTLSLSFVIANSCRIFHNLYNRIWRGGKMHIKGHSEVLRAFFWHLYNFIWALNRLLLLLCSVDSDR